MNNSTTYTTNQILSINTRNSGVQMRTLLSKYRDLIEEVKFYISNGMSRKESVDFVLNEEFKFMFVNNTEEKENLRDWMTNQMR